MKLYRQPILHYFSQTNLNTRNLNKKSIFLPIQQIGNIIFYTLVTYLCCYRLWLSSDLPYHIAMFSPDDGTWFAEKARLIFAGEWLGDYNNKTLIKGPLISSFLSTIAMLGIPPRLAVDVLYVVACLFFLKFLLVATKSKTASLVGFIFMLINPVTYSVYWTSIIRQQLYLPASLIFLSSLLIIISHYYNRPTKLSIKWLLICSLSLAIAWNTREESIWMAACVALAVLISWAILPQKTLGQTSKLIVTWLSFLLIPLAVHHAIASKNFDEYGFYGVVDFKAPQFKRAIKNIYSLTTRHVPGGHRGYKYSLTQETKNKLLSISNHTEELVTALLDDDKKHYKSHGNNVIAGNASWAIRDAMAHNGYYQSFQAAEAQYQQIAQDIETFCDTHANECRPPLVFNIVWFSAYNKDIIPNLIQSSSDLFAFTHFSSQQTLSKHLGGDAPWRYLMSRFLNYNGHKKNPAYEHHLPAVNKQAYKKQRKRDRFYKKFHDQFLYLSIISLIIAIASILWGRKKGHDLAIYSIILCCFASTFFIYLLVSVSTMPITRLLITCSAPMIAFSSYSIALLISRSQQGVIRIAQSAFTKITHA